MAKLLAWLFFATTIPAVPFGVAWKLFKANLCPKLVDCLNISQYATNVSLYDKLEVKFGINGSTATNPYFRCGRYAVFTHRDSNPFGDGTMDGTVDGKDYVLWFTNHTHTSTTKPGDANGDGKVDGLDYVIWLTNYGKRGVYKLI